MAERVKAEIAAKQEKATTATESKEVSASNKTLFERATPWLALAGTVLGLISGVHGLLKDHSDEVEKQQTKFRAEKKLELHAFQLGKELEEIETAYQYYPKKSYLAGLKPEDALNQNKDIARQTATKLGMADVSTFLSLYDHLALSDKSHTQLQHGNAVERQLEIIRASLLADNNPHVAEAFDLGEATGSLEGIYYKMNATPERKIIKPTAQNGGATFRDFSCGGIGRSAVDMNKSLTDLGLKFRLKYLPADHHNAQFGSSPYLNACYVLSPYHAYNKPLRWEVPVGSIMFTREGWTPADNVIVGDDAARKYAADMNSNIETELQALATEPIDN